MNLEDEQKKMLFNNLTEEDVLQVKGLVGEDYFSQHYWKYAYKASNPVVVSSNGDVVLLNNEQYLREHKKSRLQKVIIPKFALYSFNDWGYKQFSGIGFLEKPNWITVHQQVCILFCPRYQPELEVNHKDGNKLNNNYSNLEWITHEQNVHHYYTDPCFEDTRKRMSEYHSEFFKGRVFIYKDGEVTRVKSDELDSYLRDGWIVPKFIVINKDSKIKHVPEEELEKYLKDGWEVGDPNAYESGRRASEYSCCVHNGEIAKRIKPEDLQDYLDNGWQRGHLPSNDENVWKAKREILGRRPVQVHKGLVSRMIPQIEFKDYLEDGWKKGPIPAPDNGACNIWFYNNIPFNSGFELRDYLREHGYPTIDFTLCSIFSDGGWWPKKGRYVDLADKISKIRMMRTSEFRKNRNIVEEVQIEHYILRKVFNLDEISWAEYSFVTVYFICDILVNSLILDFEVLRDKIFEMYPDILQYPVNKQAKMILWNMPIDTDRRMYCYRVELGNSKDDFIPYSLEDPSSKELSVSFYKGDHPYDPKDGVTTKNLFS